MSEFAARWKTASKRSLLTRESRRPWSSRSNWWNEKFALRGMWARFSSRPSERLSTTTTLFPRASNASHKWLPMTPAPPVTSRFMSLSAGLRLLCGNPRLYLAQLAVDARPDRNENPDQALPSRRGERKSEKHFQPEGKPGRFPQFGQPPQLDVVFPFVPVVFFKQHIQPAFHGFDVSAIQIVRASAGSLPREVLNERPHRQFLRIECPVPQ